MAGGEVVVGEVDDQVGAGEQLVRINSDRTARVTGQTDLGAGFGDQALGSASCLVDTGFQAAVAAWVD